MWGYSRGASVGCRVMSARDLQEWPTNRSHVRDFGSMGLRVSYEVANVDESALHARQGDQQERAEPFVLSPRCHRSGTLVSRTSCAHGGKPQERCGGLARQLNRNHNRETHFAAEWSTICMVMKSVPRRAGRDTVLRKAARHAAG